MWRLQNLLAVPAIYRLFTQAAGGDGRRNFVRDYLYPEPGQRILDIGCGPGEILDFLPAVDYLGVDIDPNYIARAIKRYGSRGTFRCEDIADTVVRDAGSFDLVLASGVLHHLDDGRARKLLQLAAQALKPSGRLVTLDGCFVPEQSHLARLMLRMDRGEYVRKPEEYLALAAESFGNVKPVIRHDLIRIPYTHIILECHPATVPQSTPAKAGA